MFDFEENFDVERVLLRGLRRYKEKVLHLDRWRMCGINPMKGVFELLAFLRI